MAKTNAHFAVYDIKTGKDITRLFLGHATPKDESSQNNEFFFGPVHLCAHGFQLLVSFYLDVLWGLLVSSRPHCSSHIPDAASRSTTS